MLEISLLINNVYPKPDISSPLYSQWERVNHLVITWILNSVAEEISDGLNFFTTAGEIWQELKERFSGVSGHRVFQVMKDFHSLEQGTKSVEVYFHKLKGLWDEYTTLEPTVFCSCGAQNTQVDREQKRKLLQFLTGLHESNATVRGQILMMDPLPSLSQAYAYVKQDEKARQRYQSLVPAVSSISNALLRNSASTNGLSVTTNNKKLPPTNGAKSAIKCSQL